MRQFDVPMAARGPVTYQRDFIQRYTPNQSQLMPREAAEELYRAGSGRLALSAGGWSDRTFMDSVVDLAWNSSRLEGNRYSLNAVAELLNGGAPRCDTDTVMLLNHRAAVEFLAEGAFQDGLSALVLRNVHAILMQDLVPDSGSLGAIRNGSLRIAGTLYSPPQEPDDIEAMLDTIVRKANLIGNSVEAALFLWVQLTYLQPFCHGNEPTSRLAANIPLMLHNCAPLTFQDVAREDYARAMLAVYEFRDTTAAADLLSWTYQRSVRKNTARDT
ncbi:filamentation induced by cAMP protein fic [Ralstonia pickettii]|nr:filamentation induced by cAMP protein fic [Ralstonia pickettii]